MSPIKMQVRNPAVRISVVNRAAEMTAGAARVIYVGGSGETAYQIGFGLELKDGVLAAEVGASSFLEIPNTKVQDIFNKVMEG